MSDVTSFPEMLGGRVKTLHPAVHAGILAKRDDDAHMAAIDEKGIEAIDVVVANLYPFRATVQGGCSFAEGVENIDIGGPSMLRGAAKNHAAVLPLVDPADYGRALEALRAGDGSVSADDPLRKELAWKTFQHVAAYDALVAEWLWAQQSDEAPPALCVPMERVASLRYGENSHQPAGIYADLSLREDGTGGVARATVHHGKEMSYNNYLDAQAAWGCVNDLPSQGCVVVKHTNPCGVACGDDILEAYRDAVRADATSAFGGIVAFNCEVDEALAKEIREFRSPNDGETRMFYEIVIAPSYTPEGLETLKGKSKNLRILEAPVRAKGCTSLRQAGGGWLMQAADDMVPGGFEWTCPTKAQPTEEQVADAMFAWVCVKHVGSNAITIAKGSRMLGMGSGQPNRVFSTEIAMGKAGEEIKGAALASDAFFPFARGDSVEMACKAGVGVIIQPGGSMRDQDAIDVCDEYGVAMIMTGVRHFKH